MQGLGDDRRQCILGSDTIRAVLEHILSDPLRRTRHGGVHDLVYRPLHGGRLIGLGIARQCPALAVRLKAAPAASPPKRQKLFASLAAKKRGCVEQQPEHHRAIIVGQVDEAGLGDEPAELDQLAGALAPLHDPVAGILAGAIMLKPTVQHSQAVECRPAAQQLHQMACGSCAERRPRPAYARPPCFARRPSWR